MAIKELDFNYYRLIPNPSDQSVGGRFVECPGAKLVGLHYHKAVYFAWQDPTEKRWSVFHAETGAKVGGGKTRTAAVLAADLALASQQGNIDRLLAGYATTYGTSPHHYPGERPYTPTHDKPLDPVAAERERQARIEEAAKAEEARRTKAQRREAALKKFGQQQALLPPGQRMTGYDPSDPADLEAARAVQAARKELRQEQLRAAFADALQQGVNLDKVGKPRKVAAYLEELVYAAKEVSEELEAEYTGRKKEGSIWDSKQGLPVFSLDNLDEPGQQAYKLVVGIREGLELADRGRLRNRPPGIALAIGLLENIGPLLLLDDVAKHTANNAGYYLERVEKAAYKLQKRFVEAGAYVSSAERKAHTAQLFTAVVLKAKKRDTYGNEVGIEDKIHWIANPELSTL